MAIKYFQNQNTFKVSVPTAEGITFNVEPLKFVKDDTGIVYNRIALLTEVTSQQVIDKDLVYTYSPVEFAKIDPATGKLEPGVELDAGSTLDLNGIVTNVDITSTSEESGLYFKGNNLQIWTDDGPSSPYVDLSPNTGINMQCGPKLVAQSTNLIDIVSNNIKIRGYSTPMHVAPSSPTDTGVIGEVRFCADAIYVCTATDTWVKAVLSTWTV